MTESLAAPRAPVCIVGAGHFMVGPDRIGPRVLELIDGRYDSSVEVCDVGSSPLAILDVLAAQELLIVVDAALMKAAPGEVLELNLKVPDGPDGFTSVHQIGPLETLAMAEVLYKERMPEMCRIFAVETGGLDEDGIELACRRVVERLDQAVDAWRAERRAL